MITLRRTEAQEQEALFDFLSRIEGRIPPTRWIFHVPNGGARHPATGAALKRAGVKKGVPDLLWPYRSGIYTGLAIELKAEGGRKSVEQAGWLAFLANEGWQTWICYGWEDAARRIVSYVGVEPAEYGL